MNLESVWQICEVLSGAVSSNASCVVDVQSDRSDGKEHDHRQHVWVLRAAPHVRPEWLRPCTEYVIMMFSCFF